MFHRGTDVILINVERELRNTLVWLGCGFAGRKYSHGPLVLNPTMKPTM